MVIKDTPLLDQINVPSDLRNMDENQLQQVADEVRQDMIQSVSHTGGHLGAGLGVVELTTALHYIFNTPDDRLIWDVGHQCYPHKILTGRRDKMLTMRQGDGLSGFTKRKESEYDPFGAGHSSTSISAGLGMAVARDLAESNNHVVSVIGDGSISAGMAFEAMNNAGALKSKLTVILNDNEMSIAPPVGAMSAYLTKLLSSKSYLSLRDIMKKIATKFPDPMEKAAARAEEFARGMVQGGTLFEELGFYYIGPIDGHNMDHLIPVLKNARDEAERGPFLIHVITQKGKGYEPAEQASDKYHGVSKFDIVTGTQVKSQPKAPTYTKVFGETLTELAKHDDKIVAINAAMPSGTGLNIFDAAFPDRCFDVGIAEQHAVTFAAGMACEGFKPFTAIYSTFLQRGYDQIVHDVAIQNLPVRFAIDRAGFVGADGSTHCGAFDITFLASLPNMIVMAPSDEAELAHMIATAADIDHCPSAVRYPRGEGIGAEMPAKPEVLEIGKGRIIREGKSIAILSIGTRLSDAMKAADNLSNMGINCTVADARFAKPVDTDLVHKLAEEHDLLVTVEEGSIGGFSTQVMDYLVRNDLTQGLKIRNMFMPDIFQDHDKPEKQLADAGLDADGIQKTILDALGKDRMGHNIQAGSGSVSE